MVLFYGQDLSKWEQHDHGRTVDAEWRVETGYFEVAPGTAIPSAAASAIGSFASNGRSRLPCAAPAKYRWSTHPAAGPVEHLRQKLVKPAFVTFFCNGIVATPEHRALGTCKPQGGAALLLRDHGHAVRYRNIRIRSVKGYDHPEK